MRRRLAVPADRVSDELIRERPPAIRAFVKTTIEGPTQDRDIVLAELEIVKELALTADAKANGIGWVNERTMQSTIDAVTEAFKLERRVAPSEVYTR